VAESCPLSVHRLSVAQLSRMSLAVSLPPRYSRAGGLVHTALAADLDPVGDLQYYGPLGWNDLFWAEQRPTFTCHHHLTGRFYLLITTISIADIGQACESLCLGQLDHPPHWLNEPAARLP
jgi:hypothetical protein